MHGSEVLATVNAQRTKTTAVADTLSETDLSRVHVQSGWTVGQILGHIAAAELGVAFFVRRAGEGELIEMDLDARDQFNDLETQKAKSLDLAALKAELADSADTLRMVFADLAEADLEKPIVWPEWPAKTIRASIPFIVEHEAEHLAQIQSALAGGR